MRRHTFDLLTPRTKTAWDKAAGKDRGGELNEEAGRHFARVDHCYRVILGRVATALVAKLSAELDEVLAGLRRLQARRGRSRFRRSIGAGAQARARA